MTIDVIISWLLGLAMGIFWAYMLWYEHRINSPNSIAVTILYIVCTPFAIALSIGVIRVIVMVLVAFAIAVGNMLPT